MTQPITSPSDLIVRATASRKGRHLSVSPKDGVMKQLHYGRILLDADLDRVTFETGSHEVGLICLSGACTVAVRDERHDLSRYDGIYLPRGSVVEVSTTSTVDLIECSAEVSGDYPIQIVRYSDVEKDKTLKFTAGGDATTRTLNVIFGANVQAGRILAGFTRSAPGHWTSWPPHEHTSMLEELYVYYDMPAPAFGVQFVYSKPEEPEFLGIVRDGDAVLMPKGYHPNVAIPGHPINFVWLMAAHRETEDRKFGVVNVHPDFARGGSGLEAAKKTD
jgi:5-deoxy-glucuronate isomerase